MSSTGEAVRRALLVLIVLAIASCAKREKPTFFRTMVYTEELAARYKLPSGGTQQLEPGIHAIAYRVVSNAGEPPYCALDVYLDASLELDYPAGEQGTRAYADAENPLFFDQSVDTNWDGPRANLHTLGCRTQGKCMAQTSSGSAFWRHLAPGIALQSHRILCTMFDPSETGPTEMWLLRASADKRKVIDVMHSAGDGVFQFRIPERLLQHAAPHTRKAIEFFAKPLPPERTLGGFTVPPKD